MNQKKYKSTIVRVVIFLIAVGIAVLCLPRDESNRYNYVVNRPWSYSLLTAPFDIPVHLDSIRKKAVIDSINVNFIPVIKRDSAIEKQIRKDFASHLETFETTRQTDDSEITIRLNRAEKNALLSSLDSILSQGIADANLYDNIKSGKFSLVKVISNNQSDDIPSTGFKSQKEAYQKLLNDNSYDDSRYKAIASSNLATELIPTIHIDSAISKRIYDEEIMTKTAPQGMILQGQKIIDKGDIVTLQLYTILKTYEEMEASHGEETKKESYFALAGQVLYLLLLFGALYSYLFFSRPKYYNSLRATVMIILLIVLFLVITFLLAKSMNTWLYIIPYTIVPIVLMVFLDARTAFFAHMTTVLGAMILSLFPMEFIFCQFMAGVVSIHSIKELSKRSQLLKTALFVFIVYSISFFAVELLHNWSLEKISWVEFIYFGINAVLISFAYIFIFILEKTFGYTSQVTLVELSDINNPVLKKLSEECPGTFQHSMAVSNLAAAAADKIGANVQLVRSGALYHDIGKIDNPAFFTENQHGVNPHNGLDPMQSAKIIIGHINNGLKRADKAKLPPVIKDFIAQHHGAGKAKYFYTTWCNNHPDEEPDEKAFSYPGPNPTTKEASIMMMADAVEAASRSLKEHTPQAISGLVTKIIDGQVADGLHNDSPLSFRDIQNIKEVFINRLNTMYHSRISYPELKRPKAE